MSLLLSFLFFDILAQGFYIPFQMLYSRLTFLLDILPILYFLIDYLVKGCIFGVQKCCNSVGAVCVGIEIAIIASCVIYFDMVRFWGDTSEGVVFFLYLFWLTDSCS